MPIKTSNAYGNITISEEAISQVAAIAAMDCYGVVELVTKGLKDAFMEGFRKAPMLSGVKVMTRGDRIFLALQVVLKYGVSIEAVCESLRSVIRYTVESFTRMIVEDIDVLVAGVRV